MTLAELKEMRVAIVGMGMEGLATAAWLQNHGVSFGIIDQAPPEKFSPEMLDKFHKLSEKIYLGKDALDQVSEFNCLFRSPGVKRYTPEFLEFSARGGIITSTTAWFFDHSPCAVIGVTGTNGKGTTSSLIYNMLVKTIELDKAPKKLGKGTGIFLTGNIGTSTPWDFLDSLKAEDLVVYELSSFQLEDLQKSPHIAVVLMTTSEHLNHHKDTQEYLWAKAQITQHQTPEDYTVYSEDYPGSQWIGKQGVGKKLSYSRYGQVAEGAFLKNETMRIAGSLLENVALSLKEKKLIGDHNYENIFAASLASLIAGASLDAIVSTINGFEGLIYRLQKVAERGGVTFINDSISTTPDSSIAALQSFSSPTILILGGSSKQADFALLAQAVLQAKHIKAIILSGDTSGEIRQSLENALVQLPVFLVEKGMPATFHKISEIASAGDVVLFSPACASFDAYKNYKDRGEQFTRHAQSFIINS